MTAAPRKAALGPAAAVAALLAVAPAAAQGPEAAGEALKRGDVAEARALFGQAVKGSPADYSAVFSYASTLPPKEALRMADSLSRAPNAPGWAKARGLRFSGDHLFLREEYKKAADAYLQASKLDGASAYKHLYALSSAMDGQTEAARAVWNNIALDKTDELSGEAARILALLPKPPAADAAAINLQAVAPVNQQNNTPGQTAAASVNPPNNTPAPTAANAVTVDNAKTPSTPVAPAAQQNSAPAQTVVINLQAAPVNAKPPEPVFTIQVGAFASKENADNLVKRLAGRYGDITVSTAAGGDQTLYRVRVGTFQKKEDATAFADKLIIEAGLSARVTEK